MIPHLVVAAAAAAGGAEDNKPIVCLRVDGGNTYVERRVCSRILVIFVGLREHFWCN